MGRLKTNLRGFTLIELLIVIVILGVLAGGVILAIDPLDRINYANDSKVQTIVGTVARAAEAYAITKNGFYPRRLEQLVDSGDLKALPSGSYRIVVAMVSRGAGSNCTGGTDPASGCTGVALWGEQRSKKNGAVGTSNSWFVYSSVTGKTCTSTASASEPSLDNTGNNFINIPPGCQ